MPESIRATPMPAPVIGAPVEVFCLWTSRAPIVLLSSEGVVVEPSTPHLPLAKLFGGGVDGGGGAAACAGVVSATAPAAAPSASVRPEIAARSMCPPGGRQLVELHGWRQGDHRVSSD